MKCVRLNRILTSLGWGVTFGGVSFTAVAQTADSLSSVPIGGLWLDDGLCLIGFAGLSACIGFLAFRLHREIKLRVQVEQSAADEKSRLNAILSNAAVGVQITDRRARLVDVNHQWCRMFGYRRRDVKGVLNARAVVARDEAALYEKHLTSLLSGVASARTHEQLFVRQDGSRFWGLISTSVVRSESGRRQWSVALISDIDAQKRTEERLRESEARLRFITENTHDVVWQLDADFRVTYINLADQRMRGFDRGDVIGKSFASMLSASGQSVFELAMLRPGIGSRYDQDAVSFEVEVLRKEGGVLWADINCRPIHDQQGVLIGYIGVTRDATEQRAQRVRLWEQSVRDSLSGVFNRRYLDESLPREMAKARRESKPLSILMLDIDHFKLLNDQYGHQSGDMVIRSLAQLISRGARSGDLPCRYGGEEFLVLLPNVGHETAIERAESLRVAFSAQSFKGGGCEFKSTFSVGVASYPRHGMTAAELVKAADKALYAAKRQGRNRVVSADTGQSVE